MSLAKCLKRSLILASLLFPSLAFAQVQPIPGTPAQIQEALNESPGPWANAAIKLLVSKGIYIGYPDGTYRWGNDITRAEMAMVIARLIESYHLDMFNPEEISTLQHAMDELMGEFKGLQDELAAQGKKYEDLRKAITVIKAGQGQLDAEAVMKALNDLEQRVGKLEGDAGTVRAELDSLETKQTAQGKVQTQAAAERAAIEAELDALSKAQTQATNERAAIEAELDALSKAQTQAANKRAAIEAKLAALSKAQTQADSERAALEAGLAALSKAQTQADSERATLEAGLAALRKAQTQADNERAALEAKQAAQGQAQTRADSERAALETELTALRQDLNANQSGLASLIKRVDGLGDRLAALEAQAKMPTDLSSLKDFRAKLDLLSGRIGRLESRMDTVEKTVTKLDTRLTALEDRVTALEEAVTPERNPFYVGLALYGSSPNKGLIGQLTLGYDEVVGNLGLRVTGEIGFHDVPLSLAADVTYRATFEQVDGYAGLGGGLTFEKSGTAPFGELLIGVDYRLIKNLAVFVEGRYRPYFDGSGVSLSALGGGVQVRF